MSADIFGVFQFVTVIIPLDAHFAVSWPGEPFRVGSRVLLGDHRKSLGSTSWCHGMPQTLLGHLLPTPGVSCFSQDPCFLSVGSGIYRPTSG